MIRTYRNQSPSLGADVFIEDSAQVVGRVTLGDQSSVWFNAVIRGDVNGITIGRRTNVQDGTVIHVTKHHPTLVGDDVTIGHNVTLHGCTVGDGCLVGMGAVVLDEVVIGRQCIVGAGALLPPGLQVPDGHLVLGSPARVKRPLTEVEIDQLLQSARNYVAYAHDYLTCPSEGS